MFKKPLSNFKNSAPLRSSDRRKLKQRVLSAFSLPAEDGDLLVPEGILTAKFITHLDVPGVAYISSEGDPLWITVGKPGKGSDELIPTVYTLWKRPAMLPFICTPSAVIPVLVGGADLMIPGVMFHSSSLSDGQLVAICQYERKDGTPMMSAPLAVGRMAVSSDQLSDGKGKATLIIHTWKDHLWDSGSKRDAPEPTSIGSQNDISHEEAREDEDPASASRDTPAAGGADATPEVEATSTPPTVEPPLDVAYTKEEVSTLLRLSLLQAISTLLAALPASSFPIPLSTFYSTYVLPSRPAFPSLILPSSSVPEPNPQVINIKASSHKSLTTFIKSVEKESILTTKAPQKHAQTAELVITAVNSGHAAVQGHRSFVTIGEIEAKAAKKAQRADQEREKEALAHKELEIRELWKPHAVSVPLFQTMDASASDLYTIPIVQALVNDYITSKELVNPHDRAYVNLDDDLRKCVLSNSHVKKPKDKEKEPQPDEEFMKRDELHRKVLERMQPWYEVSGEGRDPVVKKGKLLPIQVDVKVRQGRKASTLITGFEPFFIVAEDMAEELRKLCAGATSVSPVTGKRANAGLEVLVQGKWPQVVVDYLQGKGVPKRWIKATDVKGKGK